MPRVTTKRSNEDELLVANEAGVAVARDGQEFLVRPGMKVRRSHPVARLVPGWFAPVSFDDFELEAARRERVDLPR